MIGGKATQIKYSSDEVFSRIKHENIKFIDLQFTGLTGRFHHTTISADTFTPQQMEDGLPKLDGYWWYRLEGDEDWQPYEE